MSSLQPLISSRIHTLREQRVMIDADLAELYGVQTKVLVQAVKRNLARFPADFMFQLAAEEFAALRSQSVTSNAPGRGGRRTAPYAFTEQGVAMLSSVLGSPRARVRCAARADDAARSAQAADRVHRTAGQEQENLGARGET